MSRVYRALEKAQGTQAHKAEESSIIRIFEEKKVPSNAEPALKGLEERIPKIEFPPEEGSPLIIPPLHSFSAEQFRKVKTQILHQSPTPRSLLVTSAVPKEGKSLVVFNLALSFAQERNFKTILIDADMRNPSLSPKLFREGGGEGLSNYLAGEKTWEEILFKFQTPNLKFIPAGTPSPKGPELNGSSRMKELLGQILERFGKDTYIFIDAPPILVTSDPIIFSKLVDGIILVVMSDFTPKKSIRKAVDSIDREKIIGVVFNQINLKPSKQYSKLYDRYYRE
jgi:capsular exopolysaccharide synthesis family protein